MNFNKNLNKFTDQIAVIGGGRWSRVLLQVLCEIVPCSVKISSHSRHNLKGMTKWSNKNGYSDRIKIFKNYPKITLGKSCAIIVANATKDHEKVVKWAISKNLPVLVEKPITLNYNTTKNLINLAITKKTYLGVSHVFLFAKYINCFSKIVTKLNHVKDIKVKWIDPLIENRHGEIKKYDPAVPIFIDWLPHIISILDLFFPKSTHIVQNIELNKGGSRIKIYMLLRNTNCEISLIRNGSKRKRSFEIKTDKENLTLDFTNEPGKITSNNKLYNIDFPQKNEVKPLSGMLLAFLNGAAGGLKDIRLDVSKGLNSMKIIDEISYIYEKEMFLWLNKKFSKLEDDIDSDTQYALIEIIYKFEHDTTIPINQRIEYVYKNIKKFCETMFVYENKEITLKLIRLIVSRGKKESFLL